MVIVTAMRAASGGLRMSSSPDKADARSMSDILASIRKIMAQDPPSATPAAAKPPVGGGDGNPRPGMRVPAPDGPRDQSPREHSMREQAPRDQVPGDHAKPASPAPAPAARSSAAAATATPSVKPETASAPTAERAPVPRAADEPVSLDDFLAMAAPPKDVVTTPILTTPPAGKTTPAAPTAPAPPAAAADAPPPSAGTAPEWLFPRQRPTDEAKGAAVKEPVFGAAPVATPASVAPGPSLTSPRPASPVTSAPKIDVPPTRAPMAGPAPMQARDAGVGGTRAAPPAPKSLGDLGSVVPGRFDTQGDGTTRRLGEPSADVNDRFSPASAPSPAAPPAGKPRAETSRAVPAPDLEPAFDPEIPGADALRRLIANVVPPSAMAPSAPARAPAPNADDVRTEVVLPARGRVPDAVTEPAPAAKQMEPAPVAKAPEAATPIAKSPEPAPAAKAPDAAPRAKAEPVEPTPAPAAGPAAPTAAADAAPMTAAATAHPAVRTMDETVVELLRPLLRDWLDTNMPRLIEPALKAELEALRGAMSKDKKG